MSIQKCPRTICIAIISYFDRNKNFQTLGKAIKKNNSTD